MKKKLSILIFALLSLSLLLCGVGCGETAEGPSANFIIARAEVPDAYYGVEYDLNNLIVKEDGTQYSVSELYTKDGNTKNKIAYSDMKFTSNVKNTYIYTILKATKNGKTEVSEEIRIRALSNIDYYLVNKADVLDATVGTAYDLNSLIKQKQDGVTYSVSVYQLESDGTTQKAVAVENFKFTATDAGYYYAVVTAVKGNETEVSEPMRIRSLEFNIREYVVAEKYVPEATVGEAYQLEGVINRQPYVTYTAKAYYADNMELTVKDFKVTPTRIGENFFVVFTAAYGEKTLVSDPVEITVNVPTDTLDELYYSMWSDGVLDKEINTNTDFVKVGNTSVKFSYTGKKNYYHMCGAVPFAYADEFDVTDWSNAVLSFWIYNPNNFELQLSQSMKHKQAGLSKDHSWDSEWDRVIPANGWTQVVYSFRSLGITSQFIPLGSTDDADRWSIKIHSKEIAYSAVEGTQEISYSYYIDNVNVYDYSEEMFPGLDTRSPEDIENEKFNALVGDDLDKRIVVGASDYQPNIYSAAIDNTEVKADGSTSSIKFTFTQPANKLYQNANALRGTMFLDDSNILYDACNGSSINWATAYIGLWIKSSAACNDIQLQFATTQNGTDWEGCSDFYFTTYWRGKLGTSNSEWKYLEVSLANAAIDTNPNNSTYGQAFNYYTENVTGFKFSISTELNVGTGNTATFWIDGLSIYNKQESDEFDLRAVEEARGNDKGNYTCEINYDSAYIKEGNSSLKYTFTAGVNRGIPFCYTSNFTNDLFGITADMFAEELYVGFYYKQAAVYENDIALNVGAQNNDGTKGSDGKIIWHGISSGFRYPGQVIAKNNTEWQYIEVKLSDYLTANGATSLLTDGVKQYQIYISTEINYSTATFYIDCLSVYTQSKLS